MDLFDGQDIPQRERLKQKDMAARLGITPSWLCQLTDDGIVTREPIGLYDVEKATKQHEEYQTALGRVEADAAADDDDTDPSSPIGRLKREKLAEEIKRIRRENAVAEGRLVDREEVRRAAFERARRTRDALMKIPARLAAELAADPDEHSVLMKLSNELRMVCEDLAVNI